MDTPNDVIGPINLGNPEEFTILELASLVIELTGSRSRIAHWPRPQDDPRQRRPDISKANDILKWTPKTKLAEGLNKTIEYFENLLSDNAVRASIIHERRREKRWFARNHSGAADRGRGSLGAI
jgi:UDP-glucuronate decarboxylase